MKNLTEGGEGRLILFFALPMLIGNVFQQLYNTVDSIVVGKFVGSSALAAVGVSFPVIFLMVSLIMGVGTGTTVLISQYFGSGNISKVKNAIQTTFIFLLAAAAVTTVTGIVFSRHLLILIRTPPEILEPATVYLKIIFAGSIFLFGFNILSAILRGVGDSRNPLYYLIVSTVVNIVLDLLFVIRFGWGVTGVAVATVIAQAVAFLIGIVHLRRKHHLFDFKLSEMKFDREIFYLSMRIGLPSGIQQMLVSAGMMTVISLVNGFGPYATAAFTAVSRIDSFAIMPAMNLSMALSAFTGQNLGAKLYDRVNRGYRATLGMSIAISLSISLIVIFFSGRLTGIFTDDAAVIAAGTRYLVIVGGSYVFFSTMFVTNGVVRGAGIASVPMISTILALWVVRIPVAAVLSRRIGLDGIWWSMPAGWLCGMVYSYWYYASGRWRNSTVLKRVIGEEAGF